MTQDERWMVRYNEVKAFIEGNKHRPSKYTPEERNAWNWLRHTQKLRFFPRIVVNGLRSAVRGE